MKIATYNINSVRVRLDRLLEWLATEQPEVVCLQETKATDDQFPLLELRGAGYVCVTRGQKSYNGVAILVRDDEPTDIDDRLPGDDADDKARFLACTAHGIRVITVYVPNGREVGHDHYHYKLRWFERLRAYLNTHSPAEPLVICGDFNVAPADLDVYDPKRWAGKNLFSQPEKDALQSLMDWGLSDALRIAHPTETIYTWWDYRRGMFRRDLGLRIDHLLVTRPLADKVDDVHVVKDLRGGEKPSDHAPVVLTLDLL